MGMGNFEVGNGRPIVEYRDPLRSPVQKMTQPIEMPFGWVVASNGLKESCVRWRSRGAEGRCHGNQFWDAICRNWLCVNDND